jgi:hypothetical protein
MKVKIVLGTFLLSVSLAARIKVEGEVDLLDDHPVMEFRSKAFPVKHL